MADWQIGDLALCIRGGSISCRGSGWLSIHHGVAAPPTGFVGRVVAINPVRTFEGGLAPCGCLRLHFEDGRYGTTRRFRKITPGAKIEGFEEPRRVPVKEDA